MTSSVRHTTARIINKIVAPFGLRCVERPHVLPAPELSEAHLCNARLLPNRTDVLHRIGRCGRVAEVGVGFGDFSRQILDIMQPDYFAAIDTFQLDARSWTGGHAYRHILQGATHEAYYRNRFCAEIEAGRVDVRRGFSDAEMARYDDGYFDMIYIDAAHDYDSVKRDLAVANRKTAAAGHIVLNDFTVMDPMLLQHYDIARAAQEFCLEHGWEFAYFALHRFMFCDVALKRMR